MSADTLSKIREKKYGERHARRQARKDAFIRENGKKNIERQVMPIEQND